MKFCALHITLALSLMLAYGEAAAQCTAAFSTRGLDQQPRTEGCIPYMILQFIDNSNCGYVTTPFFSHTWLFDDTNQTVSNVREPVFGYFEPGTYCISLVLTDDGINYDTATNCITVFEPPRVRISATPTAGCDPLEVVFTNTSFAPGSDICQTLIDFGDGIVRVKDSLNALDTFHHTYNLIPQQDQWTVTVRVTDCRGCDSTRSYTDLISIDRPPIADFTPDPTLICTPPFDVSFSNSSYSPSTNPLSYVWDFGDGSPPSSLQNPTHTYSDDTTYTIKLIVTDTECGHKDSTTRTITTRNVMAKFVTTTPIVCAGAPANFYDDGSMGQGLAYSWNFGDSPPGTASTPNPSYTYSSPGTYNVVLTVTDDRGCSHSDTTSVTVRPRPHAGFTADQTSSCKAPFDVTFTAEPSTAVSYQWTFGGGGGPASGQVVTHTFDTTGNHSVTLEVTDNNGCTNIQTIASLITILEGTVAFTMETDRGCAPLTVQFTNQSSPLFTIWSWNFGDISSGSDNISSLQHPEHTFNDTGKFVITFFASDAAYECFSTVTDTVTVGDSLVPAFSIEPNPVCVDEEVTFTNLTDTSGVTDVSKIQWLWSLPATSTLMDPPAQVYEDPTPENDSMEVSLQVCYIGCCKDTTMTLVILEPKADFTVTTDCDVPRKIVIQDASIGPHWWKWYFGDGDSLWLHPPHPDSSFTDANDTIHHVYDLSGSYTIRLVVENDSTGCIHEETVTVVVADIEAKFSALKRDYCVGEEVCFTNSSDGQGTFLWDYGDGTTPGGSNCHTYSQAGVYDVTLTMTDANGCTNTKTLDDLISVTGVAADFTCVTCSGCIPPTGTGNTITINDNSTTSGVTSILTYSWDLQSGNPAGIRNNNTNQPVTHTYNTAGSYTVSLTVTTDLGCSSTMTKPGYIFITNPAASFNVPFGAYCTDQFVSFNHTSTGVGIQTFWDFGDDETSGFGGHAYDTTGWYDVTLYITDVNGCRDTFHLDSAVHIMDPNLDFEADDTFSVCPPHVACFTNLSDYGSFGIRNVLWNFGDGSFSVYQNPCHVYVKAGIFAVTLRVEFENFCVEAITKTTYIHVGGATGDIAAEPDTGCIPMDVCFDANSDGAVSHYWLWGNGKPGALTIGDSICYTYEEAGVYLPAVVLTDAQSPPCSYVLYDDSNIYADTVFANFTTASDTVCRDDAVLFFDSSYSLIDTTPIGEFHWDFGDGSASPPDTTRDPVHVFRTVGPKTVCLTVRSSFGCSSEICKDMYVRDKPNAAFMVSDSVGCDTLLVLFTDESTPGISAPIERWYWNFDDPSTNLDTAIVQDTHYVYKDTGQYVPFLVVTDADGCDDTTSVDIGVYKVPDGILNPDTLQICFGDTIQLLTDSIYAGYEWTPDTALTDPAIANPLAFPRDTTTYEVLITEEHGCDKRDTVTINVVPLPPLTISPYPGDTICFGDSIQLTATGGTNHVWSPPFNLSDINIPNPVASPTSSVCYTVTNEGVGGCKNRDTLCITVSQLTAIFAGERSCYEDSTNFVDYSTRTDLPVTSWQWDFGDPNSSDNTSSRRNPAHTYSESGTFVAQLVIMDNIGCTDTTTRIITIDYPATAVAGYDDTLCLGESVQLFSSGGEIVFWEPSAGLDSANIFSPIATPLVSTTYTANITNGVCPYDRALVEITVLPPPDIQTIGDTTVLRGEEVILVTSVDRYDSVRWSPADSLSCSDCLSPVAMPEATTTYYVTVWDEQGCTNSTQVLIDVKVGCDEDQIWVASAFTPNSDGKNDEVMVHLIGLPQMNYFKVFDRWGKLMFETTDVNQGWDGRNLDGEKLNGGVYVYVCEAVCWFRKTIVKTGNVTLIK